MKSIIFTLETLETLRTEEARQDALATLEQYLNEHLINFDVYNATKQYLLNFKIIVEEKTVNKSRKTKRST